MPEITTQGEVVWIEGEIDMSSAGDLRSALKEHGSGPLILDVSHLTFMDSSGLHVVLEAAASRNGNGNLILRGPTRAIRRLLEITVPGGVEGLEVQQ